MADTWGGLAFPAAVPGVGDVLGDRALQIVGAYLQATLNVYGAAAWQALLPNRPSGEAWQPIGSVYYYDPHHFVFPEVELPALFLSRQQDMAGEAATYDADDYLYANSRWLCVYVFSGDQQAVIDARVPFGNAIVKTVAYAIEKYRDTSYVTPGETDVAAITTVTAPTSIKLPVATSTSPQAYSGAALNGAIGVGNILPRRPVTVTLSGTVGSFVNGSTITIAGLDVVGQSLTNTLTINTAGIPGTLTSGNDFSAVTSISVAGQSGTAGTLSFGTGPRPGLGSQYLEQAGLEGLDLGSWKTTTVDLSMSPAQGRTYFAVEMTLEAKELLTPDLTTTTAPNTGTIQSFVRDDASLIEQAEYLAP